LVATSATESEVQEVDPGQQEEEDGYEHRDDVDAELLVALENCREA